MTRSTLYWCVVTAGLCSVSCRTTDAQLSLFNQGSGGTTAGASTGGSSGRDDDRNAGGVGGGTGGTTSSTGFACPSECLEDTPLCNEAMGRCVECLHDGDCAEDDRPWCDSASGVCVNCLSDADCSDTLICELVSHQCRLTCSSSSDCATNAEDASLCDPNTLTCVNCLTNNDCPSKQQVCDAVQLHCD
jgi:hypothetical protein